MCIKFTSISISMVGVRCDAFVNMSLALVRCIWRDICFIGLSICNFVPSIYKVSANEIVGGGYTGFTMAVCLSAQ